MLRTLGIVALLVGRAQPQRVYIACDDPTDRFWSGDGEDYRQAFLQTVDYYLDLADGTADLAPAGQSRWNCDGTVRAARHRPVRPRARKPGRLRGRLPRLQPSPRRREGRRRR